MCSNLGILLKPGEMLCYGANLVVILVYLWLQAIIVAGRRTILKHLVAYGQRRTLQTFTQEREREREKEENV